MVYNGLREMEPGLIVSSPDASIYTVIDVRNIVKPGFDAVDFVLYCAGEGAVDIDGVETTLLVAPMKGFYNMEPGEVNPGATQFRISFVGTSEQMAKVPELFVKLLKKFEEQR
jgi:aspartate aminotransferase